VRRETGREVTLKSATDGLFRFDNKTYSRQLASASSGRAKPKRCQPSLARSSPRSRLRGRGAAGPRSPSLAAARRPATKTRAWSERATSDDLHSLIYQPAVAPFVVLSRTGHATPTAAAHACRLQCGIFTGIIPGFYFFDLFSEWDGIPQSARHLQINLQASRWGMACRLDCT
jgi:hypothetical protein